MNKLHTKSGLLFALMFILPIMSLSQTCEQLALLKEDVEENLTSNILPFWINNVQDPDGGFYGTVLNDGTVYSDSERGAVMNARIVWTFSTAYRLYSLDEYKRVADRAANYYIDHFIDKKYGGVFWTIDGEGSKKDDTKQSYANAFGIYGLAEHFRATGCQKSLDNAIALYNTLEDKAHDKERKGYYEVFCRDYSKQEEEGVDSRKNVSKTMNTHIHILEAYTTLYKVWPNETLKQNIIELLEILQNQLYSSKTKHLILFCDGDWNAIGKVDSYGHDIETSWLMCEAAEAIGDETIIDRVHKQAVEMVDIALAEGLNKDGAMCYERNEKGLDSQMSWWPQCETIIGCVNAWQITGNKKYFDAAQRNWVFTKAHFVDSTHGGWYKALDNNYKPTLRPKASQWDCPYHNSRMAYELMHRLTPKKVHSEVMAWSNITGIRLEGELIDFESSLCVGTLGSKMETSGREKQKNIRYNRIDDTQTTITPMHGVTTTQSVTDLDMSTVRCSWNLEATETLDESAYICFSFAPEHYSNAKISVSAKKITIKSSERNIAIAFDRAVKAKVTSDTSGGKSIYVTLMQKIKVGETASNAATIKVDGKRHHEDAEISLDLSQPGRQFAGFGGNFRIQNVKNDPKVIDYCLSNMRVAFGRVEFPWAKWDEEGANAEHIKRSAMMAQRLKAQHIPVIVSCWFPPKWAGNQTTRSDGTARAFSLKPEMKENIFKSIASYLLFLKKDYGVEADYFSFNESDLGIDIVHTPQEHCNFIKEFGQYMADCGLKTLMLLGDNSDANTFDFILPALNDKDAHKYIGAISFHSWRGCDDATLAKWRDASIKINKPLIVGEGSTDAAAYQYPMILKESTFALYEINLYTRLCARCQPLSILQWQLTSDYSPLWGDGIYGSDGPLRPTQRFWNLKQLSMTPADAFSVPVSCDKSNITAAAFSNPATGKSAVHIVNNAASCKAHLSGFPSGTLKATVYVTNSHQNAEAQRLDVRDGKVTIDMPAESFITVIAE